ncbi:hypothetical protein [Streptomyces nitrosporeus]|uniref:hypothetical protein n=1 Tax=Streptomyces nitrosporeus TaxID=28894 RepID=UPI0039A31841
MERTERIFVHSEARASPNPGVRTGIGEAYVPGPAPGPSCAGRRPAGAPAEAAGARDV